MPVVTSNEASFVEVTVVVESYLIGFSGTVATHAGSKYKGATIK